MGDESHESSAYSFAQTDDDYSSSPSRIMPFLTKLEYSEHEMEAVDNILHNPLVEKELGQFWPINKYDDMERGPIELQNTTYPSGSKRNWAGNQLYTPAYEVSPKTKHEVKQVIAKAYNEGHSITVVGGAYGSSPLVSTKGVIINTHHLDAVLDINTFTTATHPKQTITVESGIPIMSVGGGTAVGVHGTGKNFGTLCDYIEDITVLIINRQGQVEEKRFNKRDDPDEMKALSVNLGALVTYEIRDVFNLKTVDQRVKWPSDVKEMERYLHDLVTCNDYVELFWWPFTDFLWVKTWNRTTEPEGPEAGTKIETLNQYLQAYTAHPFLGLLSTFPQITPYLVSMIEKATIPYEHSVVAKANLVYNYLVAVPPKHWDLNQCLNIPYDENRRRYDFSTIASEIRKRVDDLARAGSYPLNTTLHTRFIAGSDSYLSPIYGNKLSAMVEVVSFNMTRDWLNFFKEVEDMWLSFGGRPHWGKLIFKLPDKSVWGGGTGMEQFKKKGVFRTDFHFDVFDRKLPKLMTIKIIKSHVQESLFQRVTKVGEWIGSFFYSNEYKVIVESAVDRRDAFGVKNGASMEFQALMKNVSLTNFIQFQIVLNGTVMGTAVWHLNLESDFAQGSTLTKTLNLNPNWFQLGTIEVELTPVNFSFPSDHDEVLAIVGEPNQTTIDLANLSTMAGFKVTVGVPEGRSEEEYQMIQNCIFSTPHKAAKKAPFVIFTGISEDLQNLISETGDLSHKIIIDACDRSGADSSDPLDFGSRTSVVQVIQKEDDNGNERCMLIKGEDDGALAAVSAWASNIGFTVTKLDYEAPLAPPAITQSFQTITVASLPQNDPFYKYRKLQLERIRKGYSYDHEYYKDCSVPGKYPLVKDSVLDPYYLYSVLTRLSSQFFKYQIWERLRPSSESETLSGNLPLSTFSRQYFSSTKKVWCPDAGLGSSRLGGPEPRGLRRIVKLSDIPSVESFPFTDRVLQQILSDPKATISKEIEKGRLFIVNHEFMKERVPAVPIGVFWWDDEKKQLLPIVIQVFQKFHPNENPLVTNKDGLLWEAAKIFFQVATAMVHSSCSHEYDEHVIAGAFAMATSRQLSPSHPIHVLLQPHQHRTVSHAATRNCQLRCNVPTGFFQSNSQELRALVSKTAVRTRFCSLSFDENTKERNVQVYPPAGHYPYRDDGMLFWNAIIAFVSEYVHLFYNCDTDVTADYELQAWKRELEATDGGRLHGLMKNRTELETIEDLIRIIATSIFIAGPHHAITHYMQSEYLTSPHHIFPGLTRVKWPLKGPLTPELIRNILPSKATAMYQAQIFDSASLQYDKFGDYSMFPLGSLKVAQNSIYKFQAELRKIEKIIGEREKNRRIPYPYFMPSRVPNSTNI